MTVSLIQHRNRLTTITKTGDDNLVMRLLFVVFCAVAILLTGNISSAKELYIDMPDSCYRIQGVEKNKVYLVGTNDKCVGMAMKTPVVMDDSFADISVYVDGKYWKTQRHEAFNTDFMSKAMENATAYSKKYSVPDNYNQQEANKVAVKLDEFYRSPEFQNKIATETKRIKESVLTSIYGKDMNSDNSVKGYYHDKPQNAKGDKLPMNERIYIFVSSSMPDTTLRNYIASLAKLDDPNVTAIMRGFIGGAKRAAPTMKFIKNLLVKSPGCEPFKEQCDMYRANISVDPLLFARYSITEVPAVVYVPNTKVADQLMSEGDPNNAKHGEYHVVYGDAALDYLIEVIYEHTRQKSLESVLATLRKGYY